jgi:hypothetical protein
MARLPHGRSFQLLLINLKRRAAFAAEHGDNPTVDV